MLLLLLAESCLHVEQHIAGSSVFRLEEKSPNEQITHIATTNNIVNPSSANEKNILLKNILLIEV